MGVLGIWQQAIAYLPIIWAESLAAEVMCGNARDNGPIAFAAVKDYSFQRNVPSNANTVGPFKMIALANARTDSPAQGLSLERIFVFTFLRDLHIMAKLTYLDVNSSPSKPHLLTVRVE